VTVAARRAGIAAGRAGLAARAPDALVDADADDGDEAGEADTSENPTSFGGKNEHGFLREILAATAPGVTR
jgi:hypothetical protein